MLKKIISDKFCQVTQEQEKEFEIIHCDFLIFFLDLLELLSTSVDINDLSLFKIIVEYLGDLAYEMNDMPAAVFFYNESKTIYSCTSEHSKKAKMLLCLGRCARKCMVLNQGSKLLRKGLEYAWLVND